MHHKECIYCHEPFNTAFAMKRACDACGSDERRQERYQAHLLELRRATMDRIRRNMAPEEERRRNEAARLNRNAAAARFAERALRDLDGD